MILGTSNHLKSTKVIVGLDPKNDNNLIPVQQPNSGQQAGLLGVVIDTIVLRSMDANRQTRERLMRPIRSALIKYNYGGQFRAELEKSLIPVKWLHVTQVSKEPEFQIQRFETIMPQLTEEAALIVDTFYGLESDLSKLVITANVVMYPRSEILRGLAKSEQEAYPILYRNQFIYEYALEGQFENAEQAAARWSEQDGALINRAMKAGINDIVARIASDMRP